MRQGTAKQRDRGVEDEGANEEAKRKTNSRRYRSKHCQQQGLVQAGQRNAQARASVRTHLLNDSSSLELYAVSSPSHQTSPIRQLTNQAQRYSIGAHTDGRPHAGTWKARQAGVALLRYSGSLLQEGEHCLHAQALNRCVGKLSILSSPPCRA